MLKSRGTRVAKMLLKSNKFGALVLLKDFLYKAAAIRNVGLGMIQAQRLKDTWQSGYSPKHKVRWFFIKVQENSKGEETILSQMVLIIWVSICKNYLYLTFYREINPKWIISHDPWLMDSRRYRFRRYSIPEDEKRKTALWPCISR